MSTSPFQQVKTLIKWGILCLAVGLGIGGLAAFFLQALTFVTDIRTTHIWLIMGLPICGAVLTYLYQVYGANSIKGNNLIIERANGSNEAIYLRMIPLSLFGTILTHLFGGSVGREGTAVQMGGAVAAAVGKTAKRVISLTDKEKEILIICGISGGFSSVFGTPLAGTFFSMDVLALGKIRTEALIPSFLTALVATHTTQFLGVAKPVYPVPVIPSFTWTLIIQVGLCAVVFGLVSRLFSQGIVWIKHMYQRLIPTRPVLRTFVGSSIILLFVVVFQTTRYLGLSLPLVSDAFSGDQRPLDFLMKLIFTTFSLGGGLQGGEVTPLFEIGATLGSSLSQLFHLPHSLITTLGFIGVFAGATNTPITCFILGIELFGSPIAIPLLYVCLISYLVSGDTCIYRGQNRKLGKMRFR